MTGRALQVTVELSAGAQVKHTLRPDGPTFEKRMALPAPANYAAALEFIGADGEPLDVLVYPATALAPGTVVEVFAVGILLRADEDHKVIASVDGLPPPAGYFEDWHAFFAAHGTSVHLGDENDLERVLSAREHSERPLQLVDATRYRDLGGTSEHLVDGVLAAHVSNTARRTIRAVHGLEYVLSPTVAFPDLEAETPFPPGAAYRTKAPFILPFALGDSACGFRVISTNLNVRDLEPAQLEDLARRLEATLAPSSPARRQLSGAIDPKDILLDGAHAVEGAGFASPTDRCRTEFSGRLPNAELEFDGVLLRWASELLGNAGWWGHYLEIAYVDEGNLHPALALSPGQVVVIVHLGGRFFWPAVRNALLPRLVGAALDEGWASRDQIACGHFGVRTDHPAGAEFLRAWHAALNFGFANRAAVQHLVGEVFEDMFGAELSLLGDNAHVGLHKLPGDVILHRNGQHWLYGPDSPDVPAAFTQSGHPVLLLGAPGVPSALLYPEKPQGLPLCPHGIANGPASASAGRFRLPGHVLHATDFRVDERRAVGNLERTVDIFEQRGDVRFAALLQPLVNLRANRVEEYRGPG